MISWIFYYWLIIAGGYFLGTLFSNYVLGNKDRHHGKFFDSPVIHGIVCVFMPFMWPFLLRDKLKGK